MRQVPYYTTDEIEPILRGKLTSMHAERVFLIHGKGSYAACGAADVMNEACKDLQVKEFSDYSANPKDEEAKAGLQIVLDYHPDVIIAIGGGSAMDTAKLIRHYAIEKGMQIPLWTIPTTAGTGAESTHFAVVYRNGVKFSEAAEDILPDVVVLYPPFTYNNNAYLTACTGFDALAQAIEAFWNPNATDESDVYALRAMSYVHAALPKCIENPCDTRLRDDLLWGAYWAGRAINITKTTAPHAFSYAFTTYCGYPHGHAVAITFPFFAKLNMANNPKAEELRWMLGLEKDADLQKYFLSYIKSIGLSYKGTYGMSLRDLLQDVNLERLKNNPVAVTSSVVAELHNYIEFDSI